MKKIVTLFIPVVFFTQLASGQLIDTSSSSPEYLHHYYMRKQIKNKTAGWVLLSTGSVIGVSGILINVSQPTNFIGPQPEGFRKNKGMAFFYTGCVMTATSIPFFINATYNEKKATLALKGERLTMGNKVLEKSNYTAIALRVSL